MSDPTRSSSAPELETVTNWPLIIGSLLVVVVPAVLVAGLALFSALTTPRATAPLPVVRTEAPSLTESRSSVPVRTAAVVAGETELASVVKVVPQPPAGRPISRVERTESPLIEVKPEQLPSVAVRLGSARSREKKESPKPSSPIEARALTDAELRELLDKVPELDLRAVKQGSAEVRKAYLTALKKKSGDPGTGLVAYLAGRPDLAGLPLRLGGACRLTPEAAKGLGTLSRFVRELQATRDRDMTDTLAIRAGRSPDDPYLEFVDLEGPDRRMGARLLSEIPAPREESSVSLEHMLQMEGPLIRTHLVDCLARVKSVTATEAVARRAVFDSAPEVRRAAVRALRDRPPVQVRPILLSALRHPWPPAADHAARVLVALEDREVVPALEELLKQDDPCAPTLDRDGRWVRRELVRVNHLRNCQLCHPPSLSRDDPVSGPVPTPGKPLPALYYVREGAEIVRADITFIKQDFSVLQRVSAPEKWPEMQRFDFFVRSRPLTPAETDEHEKTLASRSSRAEPAYYPQREAVAWALAELKKEKK
jgi:hypothetical protein